MYRYKLYNTDEVEKLEWELAIYKQTLETIKSRDEVTEYLKTKSEFNDLKLKFTKIKGEMKIMEENHQRTIMDYEQEKQFLSSRIDEVSDSLGQLKLDVNKVIDIVDQMHFTELIEKMNQVMNKQDDHLVETKIKIERLKEEIMQLKEHMQSNVQLPETTNQPPAPRKSEYRQLQNMLQSPNYVEQTVTPKKNNMINTQNSKRPMLNNQTFYKKNASGNIQNNVSMGQGKKTFRHSQYELNKNIITRTTPSRNNEEKKKVKT
ncbi:hypothetical protein [Oceanobacillus saliphilus]|uniref:hypothetical protein n=1 Tax=Oceanobacillus saliphilus TaxID=2925834 RepID=UPI00201E4A31|nr:hypothetical protein [Oceanobacillus saliphilus]